MIDDSAPRWEPVFWDSSGAVTPLSLLFGAIQSSQQLSLALLNVTMGQVTFHSWCQVFVPILHFQVSTVDVNQVDTGGWVHQLSQQSIHVSQMNLVISYCDPSSMLHLFAPVLVIAFLTKSLETWIKKSSHKLSIFRVKFFPRKSWFSANHTCSWFGGSCPS